MTEQSVNTMPCFKRISDVYDEELTLYLRLCNQNTLESDHVKSILNRYRSFSNAKRTLSCGEIAYEAERRLNELLFYASLKKEKE